MTSNQSIRRSWPKGVQPKYVDLPDGWRVRIFDQPFEAGMPKGSLLVLGGRGDILEKYLENFAHWHAEGWNVTSFDWRGQGGSGRVLKNQNYGHIESFSNWIDDLAAFCTSWRMRTSGPHIVIGHSMGGHLLLRALVEKRIDVDAAVLVSPMLGFTTGPVPIALSAWLIKSAAKLGHSKRAAWKSNERPAAPWVSRQKFLTHDDARFDDELFWKAQQPDLALGPPTINWLIQAHLSCQKLAKPGAPESVDVPALVIGTDDDKLVDPRSVRQIAGRIPSATLHMFGKEAAHEILRESDAVRSAALNEIDRFLAKVTSAE